MKERNVERDEELILFFFFYLLYKNRDGIVEETEGMIFFAHSGLPIPQLAIVW
jgi:hypothetical protein